MLNLAAEEPAPAASVTPAGESKRARKLHGEANRLVRGIISDARLGKQIELEKVEPLVSNMVDSIFRQQDALIPLAHLKSHDQYTFQHSVSVCAPDDRFRPRI